MIPRPFWSNTLTWRNRISVKSQIKLKWNFILSKTHRKSIFSSLRNCLFNVSPTLVLNFLFRLSYAAANCEKLGNFLVIVSGRCWRFECSRGAIIELGLVSNVIVILIYHIVVWYWQLQSEIYGEILLDKQKWKKKPGKVITHFVLAPFFGLWGLMICAPLQFTGFSSVGLFGDGQRIMRCGVVGFCRRWAAVSCIGDLA